MSARAARGTRDSRTGSEESALLARLRAGEDDAYHQLVRDYGGRMLAVARRFLRNEEDARDAVQDAFLSAFRSIGSFEGGARLSTWLHRIVVNAALMKLRTRRRKPEKPIEDLMPGFIEDGHFAQIPMAWRPSAADELESREVRELVLRNIDLLPAIYRTVLLLRDVEERGTETTAELLGITTAAVKTRLHRARLALRNLLDPHFREEAA